MAQDRRLKRFLAIAPGDRTPIPIPNRSPDSTCELSVLVQYVQAAHWRASCQAAPLSAVRRPWLGSGRSSYLILRTGLIILEAVSSGGVYAALHP
eukprot:5376249-Amphidinium_carterae.1